MSRSARTTARAVAITVISAALLSACWFPEGPSVPVTPAALTASASNGAASCSASACTAIVSVTITNTGTTATGTTPVLSATVDEGAIEVLPGTCLAPLAGTSSCTASLKLVNGATGSAHTFTGTANVTADSGVLTATAPFSITANPTAAVLAVTNIPAGPFTCALPTFCGGYITVSLINTGGTVTAAPPTVSVADLVPAGTTPALVSACPIALTPGAACTYTVFVSIETAGPVTFTGTVTATDGVVSSSAVPYSIPVAALPSP